MGGTGEGQSVVGHTPSHPGASPCTPQSHSPTMCYAFSDHRAQGTLAISEEILDGLLWEDCPEERETRHKEVKKRSINILRQGSEPCEEEWRSVKVFLTMFTYNHSLLFILLLSVLSQLVPAVMAAVISGALVLSIALCCTLIQYRSYRRQCSKSASPTDCEGSIEIYLS